MDLKDIFKKTEQINTGYYCSMVINTKGKGLPSYLMEYLGHQVVGTGHTFDIRSIFNQTHNIKLWKESYNDIKDTDTIFQLMCTFNLEMTEKDFEHYMSMIVSDYLIPFFLGCGFDFYGSFFIYSIPPEFKKLAEEGEHNVVLKSTEVSHSLFAILQEVFGMDKYMIEKVEVYFEMIGEYKVENCLTGKNIEKFKELMQRAGLNYEIE